MKRASHPVRAVVALALTFACMPAVAFAAPADVEGPFISNVTSESAVIWWRSPQPLSGEVVIGDRCIRDAEPPYEVLVSGLDPGRPYSYYVTFDNGDRRPAEGAYAFRTAPRRTDDAEFRFAVMCDSRGSEASEPVNSAVLAALLQGAKARDARFVLFPGDLIFGYCTDAEEYRRQLRLWKSAAADFMHEMPIYLTIGNHDVLLHRARDQFGPYDLDGALTGGRLLTGEEAFAQEFVNPTNGPGEPEAREAPPYTETSYSFDYGDCHFVVLNTNYWVGTRTFPHEPGDPCRLYERGNPEGRLMDRQLNWLRNDLRRARARGARHVFVTGHEPAFPVGAHVDDAMYYEGNATLSLKRDIRARQHRFWQMLSDNDVLVAFFGDEHNYSRALMGPVGDRRYDPPVWHIIAGGGGAPASEARRTDLPWSDCIRMFENRRHYCLVTVRGPAVTLEVLALTQDSEAAAGAVEFELIDHVRDLTVRD